MNLPEVSIIKISLLFTALILLILFYAFLPKTIDFIAKNSTNLRKHLNAYRLYIKILLIVSILICIRLLLTPPEPINQSTGSVSENVIQLNQTGQVNWLLIYFDLEIAWQINRITFPLLLLSTILLFLQGRFNRCSIRITDWLNLIVVKFDRFNYPANKIYSFIWISFILIYLAIVAVSWVTHYEFNLIEFAIYLIALVMIGLILIFIVKMLELFVKIVSWFNQNFLLQFIGTIAVTIGLPSVIALYYLFVTIMISGFYELISVVGFLI